ncbi:hypothetical protein [Actibacterium lipolyticum]|uniref:Sulfotransferase domain-containing protein n=1 Tax=Actibacterium lipolyticum TaxID=1524263 RepID=A0A238KSR1_9RHOB|nr:hypothetical protein [Actibacterium lipolyticum]SMX45884.1 hypothetical protein COL8621_02915 [Actibacterium lipolyticum]
MKCILHIGTEKTGTTSFQGHLSKNREGFASLGGFYPESLGGVAHRLIAVYGQNFDNLDEAGRGLKIDTPEIHENFRSTLKQKFADELNANKNASVCVISSEHLHSRIKTSDEIERIRDFLSEFFDEIVVYVHLRPQVDVLISLASTQTRVGGAVTLKFFDQARADNLYYNYKDLVQAWAGAFGDQNVVCVPFSRTPDFAGKLFGDLGLDISPLGKMERINEALDVRVMAMVNALISSGKGQRIPYQVLDQLPCEMTLKLSQSDARRIQAKFRESNEAVIAMRDDLMPGDLQPTWAKYPDMGNTHILDMPCLFASSLADLVEHFTKSAET